MHDDQHIANVLQCHRTSNCTAVEFAKNLSIKAFSLALIIGAVYVSTKPNANVNAVRFFSVCQNLTKKRPPEQPVKDASAQFGLRGIFVQW